MDLKAGPVLGAAIAQSCWMFTSVCRLISYVLHAIATLPTSNKVIIRVKSDLKIWIHNLKFWISHFRISFLSWLFALPTAARQMGYPCVWWDWASESDCEVGYRVRSLSSVIRRLIRSLPDESAISSHKFWRCFEFAIIAVCQFLEINHWHWCLGTHASSTAFCVALGP